MKKSKIGHLICGLVLFVFNDDINRWIVRKLYLSKYTMTTAELSKAQKEMSKNKKFLNNLSRRTIYNRPKVEKFVSINNFKTVMKKYKQTTETVNQYVKEIKKKYSSGK